MKRALAITAAGWTLGAMLAFAAPAAMAHDRVNWSVSIGASAGFETIGCGGGGGGGAAS